MQAQANRATLDRYVPPLQRRLLAQHDPTAVITVSGTLLFADVSGFTRLSERLARTGAEGTERLLDLIDGCFSALLDDASALGGSLLKFGGDALLLWFEGDQHAPRAAAAAVAMRATMRRIGRFMPGRRVVTLRMSVGLHSGSYDFYLAGASHRELIVAGPAATTVVAMEAGAAAGQILASAITAEALPASCLGARTSDGTLVTRAPEVGDPPPPDRGAEVDDELLATAFSSVLRTQILAQSATPEHRTATVAFVSFAGFDAIVQERGRAAAAACLNELVTLVQAAADRYQVTIIGSDIARGGGKLLLSAGAPKVLDDDEERMLLTLRAIVQGDAGLPVSAGVNRGHLFAAEVGPPYQRAYAVIGDTVNVAARLMAQAPVRHVYAAAAVIEHARTSFRLEALPALSLKGRRRPLAAFDVGPVTHAVPLRSSQRRPPLVGRDQELAVIRSAIAAARRGSGGLVEIIGETGSGKSRLLAEGRRLARGMRVLHTTCQVYTRETPYASAAHALRQLVGLDVGAGDAEVLATLRAQVARRLPDLMPWLPLLAIAFGAPTELTPEVEQLSPEVRERKLQQTVRTFAEPELAIPTLLQVEHAHLIDAASAALLRSFAQQLDRTSWAVLVTRRPVGAPPFETPAHAQIELGPLTHEQAMALAATVPESERIPPHVVELAVRRAAGSPEFLLDLLAAAAAGNRESLPASVSAAAAARLDELEPSDRTLVCRAAVLGLSFEPEAVRDTLEPDMVMPDDDRWSRLSAVFVRDPGGQLRFKRPALQEAAYASLPFKLRRRLHVAVAGALERQPTGSESVLSHHWLAAGDYARAHRYAMLAAAAARETFSHADAVGLYRRAIEAGRAAALDAEPDGRVALGNAWEELGDALRCVGEPAAAARALTAARRLLEGDPLAEARLCHRHAEVADRSQSITAVVRWLRRGLRCLDGLPGPEAAALRARMYAMLGGVRNRQARWTDAIAACRAAIAEAEAVGEEHALARASYTLDWALMGSGRRDEAVHSARALAIYRTLAEPEYESIVLNNLGMFAYFDGLWEDAVRLYQQAGEASMRAGRAGDVAYTDCNIGEIRSDQGLYEEAAGCLERARRLWTATGDAQSVAYANLLLGRLALRRGDHQGARLLLEGARDELHRFRLDGYAAFACDLIAEAEAFAGDPARALELIGDGTASSEAGVRRIRAVALARLDRYGAALDELEASLSAARAAGSDHDLAATIDVLDLLGAADISLRRERDQVLASLRIRRLPTPALGRRAVAAVG